MVYAINGDSGYIIRFTERGDTETKTYNTYSDLGEAIRTGEAMLRETNTNAYWIVRQTDGQILWERL